ncbi:MAG: stage V sporulation protein AC [Defluviitaleaceae bacterium]|nr:stage V sporulation protein AC [Defluviitaleaceae bacterium]
MNQTESNKQVYDAMVKEASPSSAIFMNSLRAFFVGGTICAIGEIIHSILTNVGLSRDDAGLVTGAVLIVTAILLTALGLYGKLGRFAGAGSIVPITGFANAIAAPAIEHKKEGLVIGLSAKMFVIAGPVIVYGTLASVIVGLIYYFVRS